MVTERAAWRVRLRGAPDAEHFMRPLPDGPVEAVRGKVIEIRQRSRYLNAVSARVLVGGIDPIASIDGVARIETVRKLVSAPDERVRKDPHRIDSARADDPWFARYGPSLDQLALTRSSDLLELGYDGSGNLSGRDPVIICVMDTGFELGHEAFSHLDVLAEYDFVDHDTFTGWQEGDYELQPAHGTTVLGAVAGYREGELIGPAHGARYILAKTEIQNEEIVIEEDNWIAALEWADSIGADVVTSSVGYVKWYSMEDLDGGTALCTVAADIAASRGITVVTAMGNGGWNGPTSMIAPADGDSVIAVGAVYSYGRIAGFSSLGPTADGRTKPDLVAMGVDVRSVSYPDPSDYGYYSGTSYATPLVAGLCAQLLEIHPDLSPAELADRLRTTASRSLSPDNTYGHGIPDAVSASGLSGSTISQDPYFAIGYPNPFVNDIKFHVFLPDWEVVDLGIFDCRGALVVRIADQYPVRWGETFRWNGRDRNGTNVAPGVYLLRVSSKSLESSVKIVRIGK